MLICILYIFFGEVPVQVFGPFLIRFNRVFVFVLLNLSDASFTNIFSQFVAHVLILLTVSFANQSFDFRKPSASQLCFRK